MGNKILTPFSVRKKPDENYEVSDVESESVINENNLLLDKKLFCDCTPCWKIFNKKNNVNKNIPMNDLINKSNKDIIENYERKSNELFIEKQNYSFAYEQAIEQQMKGNFTGTLYYVNLAIKENNNKFKALALALNLFFEHENYALINEYSNITFDEDIINAMMNFNYFILYEMNNDTGKIVKYLKCASKQNLLVAKYYICKDYSQYILEAEYVDYLKSSFDKENNLLMNGDYLLNFKGREIVDENVIPLLSIEMLVNYYYYNKMYKEFISTCELGIDKDSETCDKMLNSYFNDNPDELAVYPNVDYLSNENYGLKSDVSEYENIDIDTNTDSQNNDINNNVNNAINNCNNENNEMTDDYDIIS